MPTPRPSLSLKPGLLRGHGMGLAANASTTRGSPLSPESEDSSAGGSSGSEASYGFDAPVLPKDQEGSLWKCPHLQKSRMSWEWRQICQKKKKDQCHQKASYGMMTYPLPEEGEEGAELSPVAVAQNRDVSVLQT